MQESVKHTTTTLDGDTNIAPLTPVNLHIEEKLVRDEQTNDLYLQLAPTVVPRHKHKMLYVLPDFDKHLITDVLVDLGAYVSAVAQNDMEKKTTSPEEHPQNQGPSQLSITSSE